MPRHCSAGGCKSRDNRETRSAGITFHKLPKGATRRSLWITNCHRADSWDPQTDFVYFCSKHFTPQSFELTGCSGIRRLKEEAFPTVFDSSSTTKGKRRATQQTAAAAGVRLRRNRRSDDLQNAQQKTDGGATSKQPNGDTPASPQEPSEVEQLPQQESSPEPEPACRPQSPSRYMRRLPPPPGFYLPKEHSYAQLCPLLWRRRYDQAIDCLERALRQLHAARRRENRLRSTVLRLRDKRLKHTLLLSQDGFRTWGEKRPGKGGSNQGGRDAPSEGVGLFEDQMEHCLPDSSSCSEEEKGLCFYCGRGPEARRASKTSSDVEPAVHEDTLTMRDRVETSAVANTTNIQERPPGKSVESRDLNGTNPQVLLQAQGVQHVIPGMSREQLLLSEGASGALGEEAPLQQLFLIQGGGGGKLLLVPVPAEDKIQSFLKMECAPDEGHVSELEVKQLMERGGGQHSVLSTQTGEDVREKLKEHLEGFHLQLSTEFIN
ncbi:THAP domain-containing protein 7 [Pseudochaenichthys georgianus]|uniref:THAP domain-containing protein 7 n=1 Tax=Pseudochaenichthys georgianus TaxID=52239 RepID=UPI00146C31F4|nr:THAP domain-containing protein 7 [Pseudochaenichthys georgianus]